MENFADTTARNSSITPEKAQSLCLVAIQKLKKALSIADLQVETGLSVFDTEDALNFLMEKSHLYKYKNL